MTADYKQITLFYIGAVLVFFFFFFSRKKLCKEFLNMQTSSQNKLNLFKKVHSSTLTNEYVLSLLMFV
jgi:hypothetical protein